MWNTRSPLDGNIQVRDVMKDEFDHLFVPLLAYVGNERLGWQSLPTLIGRQTVFSKRVVEIVDD
jgi:hypothetical protein